MTNSEKDQLENIPNPVKTFAQAFQKYRKF